MSRIVGRVMSVAIAVAIALVPVTASAQLPPSTSTTGSVAGTVTAPVVTAADLLPTLEVQLWPDDQQVPGSASKFTSLVVTAEFPSAVKLPATMRVPLPDGAQVQWVGEVFGGDPKNDVERSFRTGKGTGGGYIDVTLQQGRMLQYEALWEPTGVEADKRLASLKWVQSVPTGAIRFAVKTPAYARELTMTPAPAAPPRSNQQGEQLYTSAPVTLDVGKSITLSLQYAAGIAPVAPPAGSNVGTLVPVLLGALLIVLVAIALLLRQRSGTSENEE